VSQAIILEQRYLVCAALSSRLMLAGCSSVMLMLAAGLPPPHVLMARLTLFLTAVGEAVRSYSGAMISSGHCCAGAFFQSFFQSIPPPPCVTCVGEEDAKDAAAGGARLPVAATPMISSKSVGSCASFPLKSPSLGSRPCQSQYRLIPPLLAPGPASVGSVSERRGAKPDTDTTPASFLLPAVPPGVCVVSG
jgi:hypothetical protein